MSSPPRAIGSVLALLEPTDGPLRPDGIWASWTGARRNASGYSSARSALAALLRFRDVERVWLPAYACAALAEGAVARERLWYGVDAALEPDLGALEAGLRSGDAVVAIAYFGRHCGEGLRRLAASRPDVLWIEDRAQALDAEIPVWAEAALYSPRKLVGVGDGGVLVSDAPLPAPGRPGASRSAAQAARGRDPEGHRPELWFPLFQAQETAFAVDDVAISTESRQALERTALPPLAAARVANAAVLHAHLGDLTLWSEPLDTAPLAVPVRIARRDAVAAALAQRGLYCARHWPELPSNSDAFPLAHRLAGELLSLPCDHRYDADDMLRIVAALRALQAEGAR